jgi:hypothetical protein
MADKTTPLYIVCSPSRCIGKTLVSRLLTEFFILNDRQVAAFDLADEGPQLLDYLPQFTTIARIGDIYGQVSFFEQIIADQEYTKIVDLSYRSFELFFNVVEQIGFFDEARLRSVEPIILFIADASPQPPRACATLQQRFAETLILPVRNRAPAMVAGSEAPPNVGIARPSLQVPLLSFSLQAQIDRQDFSFRELWRTSTGIIDKSETKLRDWIEGVFLQFRAVEIALGRTDVASLLMTARSAYATIGHQVRDQGPLPRDGFERNPTAAGESPREVPCEALNFTENVLRDGVAIDQYGDEIVEMVQSSGRHLLATKNRIKELEIEIGEILDHAKKWLQLLAEEIEGKR